MRARLSILVCKKRLAAGDASAENCVLNPEVLDAIIEFLPVSLTNEGSTWLQCEYAEYVLATDVQWLARRKEREEQKIAIAKRMMKEAKENPEEFKRVHRVYDELENYFVFGGNFGYPSEFENAIEQQIKKHQGKPLQYWDRISPLFRGMRNYNQFGLWSSQVGSVRSQQELKIREMRCMIQGWPKNLSKSTMDQLENGNLHSHGHCYLDGFLAVDLSEDCAQATNSGQEFQRPSKVIFPDMNGMGSFAQFDFRAMGGDPNPPKDFDPRCVPCALVRASGLVKAKALNGMVGICINTGPLVRKEGITDFENTRMPVLFPEHSGKPVSVKLKNINIVSPSEAPEVVLALLKKLQPKPVGKTRAQVFAHSTEKWSPIKAQAELKAGLEKAGASPADFRILVSFDN